MNWSAMHKPVLLEEVVSNLTIQPDDCVFDGTIGFGGHAAAIIPHLTRGLYIGVDRDAAAIQSCKERFSQYKNLKLFHGSFAEMPTIIQGCQKKSVAKIILDLGFSSYQLDTPERGFSFQLEGPLDMRMDDSNAELQTASAILMQYDKTDLIQLFKNFGELYNLDRFVDSIIAARKKTPITTTADLINLIKGGFYFHDNRARYMNTCARVFQALRIEVNQELEQLETFLRLLPDVLCAEGRAAIISFHSLEDRMVKHFIKQHREVFDPINKKVIMATQTEIHSNPRAKPAKLRVFKRR